MPKINDANSKIILNVEACVAHNIYVHIPVLEIGFGPPSADFGSIWSSQKLVNVYMFKKHQKCILYILTPNHLSSAISSATFLVLSFLVLPNVFGLGLSSLFVPPTIYFGGSWRFGPGLTEMRLYVTLCDEICDVVGCPNRMLLLCFYKFEAALARDLPSSSCSATLPSKPPKSCK